MDAAARWRDEQILLEVAEATSAYTGERFFQTLARQLAIGLGVRSALIAECLDDPPTRVRTLAFWDSGGLADNIEYELVGTPCQRVIAGGSVAFWPQSVQASFPENHWLRASGAQSYVGVPLCGDRGQIIGHLALIDTRDMQDETMTWAVLRIFAARAGAELARLRAEAALRQEKERAEVTLASIADAVVTTDAVGRVTDMNPSAVQMTGWIRAEAIGLPAVTVLPLQREPVGRSVGDPVTTCLHTRRAVRLIARTALIARNGAQHPVQGTVSPMFGGEAALVGTVIVLRDVSDVRYMERRLFWQRTHDPATGLPNRTQMEEQLAQAVRIARQARERYCFLYLDIDQFRVINDNCGHAAGDRLIQDIAALIRTRLRSPDVVARLGGDEFGILLRRCRLDRGRTIAGQLLAALRAYRFTEQDCSFDISASIGLTEIGPETEDAASAMGSADVACFVAKELGRNRLHCYVEGDEDLAKRRGEMRLVSRISLAIQDDRVALFGQRIVALGPDDACSGLIEVLVRIREGDSWLSPQRFVEAAERYGLMATIDRTVIRKSLALWRRWADAGDPRAACRLAINLSGTSLRDDGLVDYIEAELASRNVPPEYICFEITETAAVANLARLRELAARLKRLGCSIALDDFGCGLSSFSYLKMLEVDFLKIYGGFVESLAADAVDRGIVEAFNQVGHVLGLSTVAEGVESEAALSLVRAIGIDYAQGFLLDEPVLIAD